MNDDMYKQTKGTAKGRALLFSFFYHLGGDC
jgi:hypothetical protein